MDEKILERFYNRYDRYNTKVLKTLGETAKKFNNVDYMEAVIIAQGLDQAVIVDLLVELEAINALTMKDINQYLDIKTEGRLNYHKEHFEYRGTQPDKYIFKEITDKYKKQILSNLPRSNNVGFVFEDDYGNKLYRDLGNTYQSLIDKAVKSVTLGKEGYQNAIRNTLNQLADSGVKIHQEKLGYPSGRNIRLDSMVKQSILDSYREYQNEINEEIGKQIGADGVEISHHINCALDHYIIDGQQFTNEKFEEINNNLERQIGTYNCRHIANPIILGVDKPQYTKEQLKKDRIQNEKGFEYNGKHYTNYDGTQLMRKVETAIRRQKDRQIMGRSSNDKEMVAKAQSKITELTTEYNKISKISGLPPYKQRLTVSGYKRVKV